MQAQHGQAAAASDTRAQAHGLLATLAAGLDEADLRATFEQAVAGWLAAA